MAQQFKIGDIVQLKSGGPKMTVNATVGQGTYRCSWFAGSKHESAFFGADALKSADLDEPKKA